MNNKRIIWITSLLCLLPLFFSAAVYSGLPEQIAIHWNSAGEADNYVNKAIGAFGIPILFVAINLMLTKMRYVGDPKGDGQVKAKGSWLIYVWTAPVLSVLLTPITLLMAMGVAIPITMVASLIVGIVLIILGNYLPKSRQNSFFGIKLPWTMKDTNNWNKTQRIAGYVWITGGLLVIICSFLLPHHFQLLITLVIAALLILTPAIYSYIQSKGEKGTRSN